MLRCYSGTHEEKDIIMRNYIRNDWQDKKKCLYVFNLILFICQPKLLELFPQRICGKVWEYF